MHLHSTIWTILVIGLCFCLGDVLYIMCFVDRHANALSQMSPPTSSTMVEQSSTASTKKNQQEHSMPSGGGGREPILNLLREAGIPLDPVKDQKLIEELPTWSEVTELYGDKPVIYGLDRCEEFQTHSDPADHFVVSILYY